MLKFIKKYNNILILCIIAFLVFYSFIFAITSEEKSDNILKFILVSWIVFFITFVMFSILLKIQSKNIMITEKMWSIIISFFIIISLLFSISYLVMFIINHTMNHYMIIYPLNGIIVSIIKNTGDG